MVYVSVLINLDDSKVIGIYQSWTQAVKKTFEFLVNEEYLDYSDEDISNEEFLKILEKETDHWKYMRMYEVCKRYNSGYDNKHMFVLIEGIN